MKEAEIELSGRRIAWVLPAIEAGSGGLQTICRHISYLQSLGVVCDAVIYQPTFADSERGVRKLLSEAYQCEPDSVYVAGRPAASYDAVVATLNSTVPFARTLDAARRFYFVQDYEPYFYAMGGSYLAARRTYSSGFSIVTIGRWLAHKLHEEHGAQAWYTDFAADESIYRPLGLERRRAVCAIYQPAKDRRCPDLVLDALEIVHAVAPDIDIVLYGADGTCEFPFPVDFRGLVSKEECNRIYNECSVGLCISSTNPSRIPFEMMAAGLPVIDVYRENTCWDYDTGSVILAEPTPAALAQAVLRVASNPDYARSLGDCGTAFMRDRVDNSEQKAFASALQAAFAGETPQKAVAVSPGMAGYEPIVATGEFVELQDALANRKMAGSFVPPAVDCDKNYAKLCIGGIPYNGTHKGVYAFVIPFKAKNMGRRFDAYGMDAAGNVLVQIDFNRLERRSDLYSCHLFVERDGESVFLAECTIRGWFDGGEGEQFEASAGPFAYHDPMSGAERLVSFEFSQAPFADLASAAAFALLPAQVRDAIRPIAKMALGR